MISRGEFAGQEPVEVVFVEYPVRPNEVPPERPYGVTFALYGDLGIRSGQVENDSDDVTNDEDGPQPPNFVAG